MVKVEVEEGEATELRPLAAAALARHVPYPLSKSEIQAGWDTLIHKSWLRCARCHRWRSVPEAVRDEVRAMLNAAPLRITSFSQVLGIWMARVVGAMGQRCHRS